MTPPALRATSPASLGRKKSFLIKVAQRPAGCLDVGDAPAHAGPHEVEGDLGALALIVETDLADRLGPIGLDRYGEIGDVPVLRIDEGITVESRRLATSLGFLHVGLDDARKIGREEAV